MNNTDISKHLDLLSKLIIIHRGDEFKSRTLSSLSRNVDILNVEMSTLSKDNILSIKGLGKSSYAIIEQLIREGSAKEISELLQATPSGVLQLMKLKGLGVKTIAKLWHDHSIDSPEMLLEKCNAQEVRNWKGFGEKKEIDLQKSLLFHIEHKGKFLFRDAEQEGQRILETLKMLFPKSKIDIVGELARQLPVISVVSFLIDKTLNTDDIKAIENKLFLAFKESDNVKFSFVQHNGGLMVDIHHSPPEHYENNLFKLQSSQLFIDSLKHSDDIKKINQKILTPPRREYAMDSCLQTYNTLPIEVKDIKGLVHCHSVWSDGKNTIEEMARSCIDRGLEYMVISDHSKTAFYANGLKHQSILQQHKEIDILNEQFHPFKIFKSIESDILPNGDLDYSHEVLESFDMVIGSIHSNLNMDKKTATSRLIKAINNSYMTILGHPTGRLLTARPAYPIDYDRVIDACIDNKVIIEMNANPHRLDIDWSFVDNIIDKGGLLSINPDAHSMQGINDLYYGVSVAQKTKLSPKNNFSSFSLQQVENYIAQSRDGSV